MTAPAIRTQVDGLNEEYSWDTAVDCSILPDLARQEFKEETDVNNVLARYGVNTQQREPQYGEVDYNLDLQQALASIKEAQRAITKLPEALRTKYSSWEYLLDGVANGEFGIDLKAYFVAQAAEKAAVDRAATAAASSTEPKP